MRGNESSPPNASLDPLDRECIDPTNTPRVRASANKDAGGGASRVPPLPEFPLLKRFVEPPAGEDEILDTARIIPGEDGLN